MINLYLADEREYTRGLAHKLLDEKIIDLAKKEISISYVLS